MQYNTPKNNVVIYRPFMDINTPNKTEAEKLFKQSIEFIEQNNYDKAIELMKKANFAAKDICAIQFTNLALTILYGATDQDKDYLKQYYDNKMMATAFKLINIKCMD